MGTQTWSDSHNKDEELHNPLPSSPLTSENPDIGDFVLIQCLSEKEKASLAFTGSIEEKDFNSFTINYLKRKGFLFYYPDKEDKWPITILDIVSKLPASNSAPGTSRTAAKLSFDFNF